MKCPFCQQKLKELYNNGISVGFRCKNKNCPETNIMCGTKALWQELIKLMKDKDLSDKIGKLETELERTRKALDVAVDAIKNATEYLGNQEPLVDVMAMNLYTDLSNALKQITALEQKDVK